MFEHRPQICVGGPLHGQLVDYSGNILIAPILQRVMMTQWGGHYEEGTCPPPRQILHTEYRQERMAIGFGSIHMEAHVWVWYQLQKENLPNIVMGLAIANALGKGENLRD